MAFLHLEPPNQEAMSEHLDAVELMLNAAPFSSVTNYLFFTYLYPAILFLLAKIGD